ncbi:MAG: response regulator [Bacteroidales bacterium]|jgi:DNA-binding NtrC family response regulator
MNEKAVLETTLSILSLEDSIQDFELIRENLKSSGTSIFLTRVENRRDFLSSLTNNKFDLILADFNLPGFDAFGALEICNQICSDVPFICVSGSIGEETAIELIKLGAVDYVLKDRLVRLPVAIKRALDEAKEKEIRRIAEESLKAKMEELQRFHDLTVGRELAMIELKKEVNELLLKSGQTEKYKIVR